MNPLVPLLLLLAASAANAVEPVASQPALRRGHVPFAAVAGAAPFRKGQVDEVLRRIPADPMTGRADWGLRAYTDAPDASTWGGESVFDVYSKAPGRGLDGTRYRDW
jgi:hypothetical protein